MKHALTVALATSAACSVGMRHDAHAALPRLIPRDVLFGTPATHAPSISPDGRQIAYVAPDSGISQVWVRPRGAATARVVTHASAPGVSDFHWQYDSAHILYLHDRDGNEDAHLYQSDIATRTTRDLTPFDSVSVHLEALDPAQPDVALIGLNRRDPRARDAFRLTLSTGALELAAENPGDVDQWVPAHGTLAVVAAMANADDGGVIVRARDDESAAWRTLVRWSGDDVPGDLFGLSADNRELFATSSVDAEALQLLAYDLRTGAQRVVAGDSTSDVSAVLFHPRTHAVQAVQFTFARKEWRALDAATAADFASLRRSLDADVRVLSADLRDRWWTVSLLRDNASTRYALYDRTTRRITPLFDGQPALARYTLARQTPISYIARDGLRIHGYLSLPVGVAPRHLPLVLLVHGGPWDRDLWGFNPWYQLLTNRGYAVLSVNFRGSTGYGKRFVNAGDREWGAAMQNDLLDARRWAIARGIADSTRIAMFGASYGGYATLVGLTFTPDVFAAGASLCGPADLNHWMANIPPYWSDLRAFFARRIGSDSTMLHDRSPVYRASAVRKPLLVAQGALDVRVRMAESDSMVAAVRRAGQPVTYIVYADEGHGLAKPGNTMHFAAEVEAFFARTLGGRAEPRGRAVSTTASYR